MNPFRIHFAASLAALRRPSPAGGFTLIELMVTVAIAAIFATLAGPSMVKVIRSNRIQTEASSLVADLQLARNEAIKRGLTVTVCPSSTANSCLATDVWQTGWMTFVDINSNGAYDSAEAQLRQRAALATGNTVAPSPAPTTHAVSFNRDGFATGMGTTTTVFKFHTADNDTKATRCVSIDLAGRITTLTYGGNCT